MPPTLAIVGVLVFLAALLYSSVGHAGASGYPHRSCLPLVQVDLGGMDVTGGVAHSECDEMFGL